MINKEAHGKVAGMNLELNDINPDDCEFAKNKCCTALACYDNLKCSAKDENGYPKYE